MKLSKLALLAIKGCGKDFKTKMAESIGVSEATVYRWINENDDSLTKAMAMQVIREETGLVDSQILESEAVEQN